MKIAGEVITFFYSGEGGEIRWRAPRLLHLTQSVGIMFGEMVQKVVWSE